MTIVFNVSEKNQIIVHRTDMLATLTLIIYIFKNIIKNIIQITEFV